MAFQDNAWCDENIMKTWINQQWKPACNGNMMLVMDVHKAQTTNTIKHMLRSCNTEPVLVPPGTTSLVQPVDVVINAPFKAAIEEKATAHLQDNLNDYVTGKISASDRRVLFTKWVGQSWADLSTNQQMTIRSFEKCGISVPIDGSNNAAINIRGLEDYTVGLLTSDDEDPFDDDDPNDDEENDDSFDDDDPFDDNEPNDDDEMDDDPFQSLE